MGRRALIVGIDDYDALGPGMHLSGAVADAECVKDLLARHADDTLNYHCHLMTSDDDIPVTRTNLRRELQELFRPTGDEVLFYFAGHGTIDVTSGSIVTQDGSPGDIGISMDEILGLANDIGSGEAIIILDCCHSGNMGSSQIFPGSSDYRQSVLSPNVSILAASRASESSVEIYGHGLFTSLLIDALDGTAGDLLGNVTLPSIYSHIEGALGPWDQRPIFKTHQTSVKIVRRAAPHIPLASLRRLEELFPSLEFLYPLSMDYEYDEVPETERQRIGQLFKKFRNVGLITAEHEGEDFYWTAYHGHSLKLTSLGRHFWRLVKDDKL